MKNIIVKSAKRSSFMDLLKHIADHHFREKSEVQENQFNHKEIHNNNETKN